MGQLVRRQLARTEVFEEQIDVHLPPFPPHPPDKPAGGQDDLRPPDSQAGGGISAGS